MTGPRSASSLASFAEDWVDGDIHGLHALAAKLYGYASTITGVTTVLDQQVSKLTSGGWPARSAFAFSWRQDSGAAEELAALITQTAAIVDGLAVELAVIENALEEEAYVASRYGAKIGTDGQPPPAPAGLQAGTSERHWVVAYKLAHERAMADAQRARRQAARRLTHVYEQIRPSERSLAVASPQVIASFLHRHRALSHAVCPSVVKDV